MIFTVLLLFSGALLALALGKSLQHRTGLVLALLPLSIFLYYLQKMELLSAGAQLARYSSPGGTLGLEHVFVLDGLSMLFILLVCGIGALVLIYSHGYMRGEEKLGRFYALMMFFMASMAGLVLSGDLITIYIFWELTSISSFLLIGTHHHKEEARSSAAQALLITSLGGLAMLAGFVLIGVIGGSFELEVLARAGKTISGHSLYLPALILVLLGAFTKSAQFPFHFWLPRAMVAPTPVSAYLHSAAMVNAGIFLLARLHPCMGDTITWRYSISSIGALTLLVGAYCAVTQTDLKKILAYSTVSSLGMLTLLLGIGTKLAVEAALLYLVVHALYKASMFMIAGTIDDEAGSRNIYLLGNLKQKMPLTTLIAMLVLLSMAGLPPMLGYVSKEMIYEAKMQVPGVAAHIIVTGVLGNMFMLLISLIIAYNVFLRNKRHLPQRPSEPAISFMLGPAILAVLSFVLVPFSDNFSTLIEHGVEAAKVKEIDVHITLWKGMKPAFWLSLLTIAGGAAMFLQRRRLLPLFEKINARIIHFHYATVFTRMINLLLRSAETMTRSIQHGYHRIYLLSFFIIASAALWFSFIRHGGFDHLSPGTAVSAPVAGTSLFVLVATIIAMFTRSKLTAIVSMGVTGYVIALVFVVHGAVDLAITQFLVDTLITVLFVFAAYKLPEFEEHSPKIVMVRDLLISLSFGAVVAALALGAARSEALRNISDFYLHNSLPKGHGANVVNVILTDFRALDTLGEITVLALAAVSVSSLLKLRPGPKKTLHSEKERAQSDIRSDLLKIAASYMKYSMLIFSLFLLVRGHHQPGGGFIAGLIAGSGIFFSILAHGTDRTMALWYVRPRFHIALGLFFCTAAATAGLVQEGAILAGFNMIPAAAELLVLTTPRLFDIGVFFTVVGSFLLIIISLMDEYQWK